MDNIRIYFFLPRKNAEYILERAQNGTIGEMLTGPAGYQVYKDKADAEAFGRCVCTKPDTELSRFSIIELMVEERLWQELEASGHILPGKTNILGTTGILLTPHACARLNGLQRERLFQEDIILRIAPEDEAFLQLPKHLLN
ncbi:MAG TPA: hypothetical protein V6C81_12610 [Planktothrix sp.]|jgi:hypothetical protein